jgi:hypothetical protein
MALLETSHSSADSGEFDAELPVTPQEDFVNSVYASVDEAVVCGLDRLRNEEGITPSCQVGCCHCCRYHIVMNMAEAHALAQYVKRELSVDQINDLRMRTHQWHEWDNTRPSRFPSGQLNDRTDLSNYECCCPLLVEGVCIAYPVRPVVCRMHFVSSPPPYCCESMDTESRGGDPVVLASVVQATHPFSDAIRDHIEDAGVDFSRSIMLLPHWLAIEMDWDFAISR